MLSAVLLFLFWSLLLIAFLLLLMYGSGLIMLWIDPLQDIPEERLKLIGEGGDWKETAVSWLRDGRELSAIELVQRKGGMSFDDARVKLFKMDQIENKKKNVR